MKKKHSSNNEQKWSATPLELALLFILSCQIMKQNDQLRLLSLPFNFIYFYFILLRYYVTLAHRFIFFLFFFPAMKKNDQWRHSIQPFYFLLFISISKMTSNGTWSYSFILFCNEEKWSGTLLEFTITYIFIFLFCSEIIERLAISLGRINEK